jgi:transcriptional regulator with XRE-family HTH domain
VNEHELCGEIQLIRKNRGLTQEALAESLNVLRQVVAK